MTGCRWSYGLVLCAMFSPACYSGQLRADDGPLQPGDHVVATKRAPLWDGRNAVLTVNAETELIVAEVKGPWALVHVRQGDKTTDGWFEAKYLARASISRGVQASDVFTQGRADTRRAGEASDLLKSFTRQLNDDIQATIIGFRNWRPPEPKWAILEGIRTSLTAAGD